MREETIPSLRKLVNVKVLLKSPSDNFKFQFQVTILSDNFKVEKTSQCRPQCQGSSQEPKWQTRQTKSDPFRPWKERKITLFVGYWILDRELMIPSRWIWWWLQWFMEEQLCMIHIHTKTMMYTYIWSHHNHLMTDSANDDVTTCPLSRTRQPYRQWDRPTEYDEQWTSIQPKSSITQQWSKSTALVVSVVYLVWGGQWTSFLIGIHFQSWYFSR